MLIAQPALPLHHFDHPDLRNLIWCLTSPVLWQSAPFSALPRLNPDYIHPALQQLERQPQPLLDALANARSHRLGSYYEALWHFILHRFYRPSVCHYGLAVRNQHRRTLGEYDFLLRLNHQPSTLHLEICIKFYLGIPRPGRSPRWLGLTPRDRLDLKIKHLTDHQLRLEYLASARHQQRQLGLQIGNRLGWMQGRLFHPWEQSLNAPDCCSRPHLSGWWATRKQLEAWLECHGNYRFQPLLKPQWLAPLASAQVNTHPSAQLPEMKNGQPIMVARLLESPRGWRELDRGVIVSSDWLNSESMLEALDQA